MKKKILVTGSNGFIGKNLIETLKRDEKLELITFEKGETEDSLETKIKQCNFIYHLAGVNRPKDPREFYEGNTTLLEKVIKIIEKNSLKLPIVLTSSIHSDKDNDYGKSKLAAEQLLVEYSNRNDVNVYIYKLQNVFGKWCKQNYNSVIATWCYNIANNLEIQINNRDIEIEFVYIDDVIKELVSKLEIEIRLEEKYFYVKKSYFKTLGEVSDLLNEFKNNRKNLIVQKVGTGFERALYATYLSYLPKDDFSYELTEHKDDRGSFVEILKTIDSGQFSISTTKPGVTRGNHYHNTKNEKFLVIRGEALVKFRKIDEEEVIEYRVSEKKLEIIDIPVGYTHSITNIGKEEMILVIWANELFNKEEPDTYFLNV